MLNDSKVCRSILRCLKFSSKKNNIISLFKPYRHGRRANGRCIFWVVLQRNAETLLTIIENHIVAGSTIKSDEWKAYHNLSTLGYNHLTVNHSISFVSLEGVHTQMIEGAWSQVKAMIKVHHGWTAKDLPGQ
jgi:hypothetical protein